MQTLVFVTGNSYKFEIAQTALGKHGISLIQNPLDTPEIQSTDVAEVAAFSAKWAAERLNQPVVVTDAGYYIEALHGFPGPFIKYVNKWLTAEDILKLMTGQQNRKAEVRISLAYCRPGIESVIFSTNALGTIADYIGGTDKDYPIDRIFIPEGFDKVDCEIPKSQMVDYWVRSENYWQQLASYLLGIK